MIFSLVACLPTGVSNAGDKDSNEAVATIVSTNSGNDNNTVNNGSDDGQNNIQNPDNPDDNGNGNQDNTESHPEYRSYPIYSAYDYTVKDKHLDENDYSSIKIIDTGYTNIYVNSSEYNDYEYVELANKMSDVNASI